MLLNIQMNGGISQEVIQMTKEQTTMRKHKIIKENEKNI